MRVVETQEDRESERGLRVTQSEESIALADGRMVDLSGFLFIQVGQWISLPRTSSTVTGARPSTANMETAQL